MSKFVFPDDELQKLDRLAQLTIVYLVLVTLASFFAGAYVLNSPWLSQALIPFLLGVSGSATAALTSCLDRYATGFERENGTVYPEDVKTGSGKFNRRFSRWLFVRPLLGAVTAPVFIWGLSYFTKDHYAFLSAGEKVGFTAFLSGYLAKSVLDLIKGLFKNIFKS